MFQNRKIFEIGFIFFLISLLGNFISAHNWQELKGEHFIVYFTQDEKFAKEVLDRAEVYYQKIALELGYPRYKEFWTWDKRVKIYIYPDRDSFLKATGQPSWSYGMADYTNKQIMSFVLSEAFLESILPHEIAHLIFRDFVGFKGEIPLWLDEGVAQWMEEKRRVDIKKKIKEFYNRDALLSLENMMRLDIRNLPKEDRIYIHSTKTKKGEKGVLFLSMENLISTYYLQSASLVGFLIEKYGSDRFAVFCRELRDGKNINDALKFSYPDYMQNINDLEERWRKYLEGL